MMLSVRIVIVAALGCMFFANTLCADPPTVIHSDDQPTVITNQPPLPKIQNESAVSAASESPAPCDCKPEENKGWLGKVLVRIFPRPGNFPIPPKGPGYYSLEDMLKHNYRKGPPKYPYSAISPMPNSFFDADFRYLDSKTNTQTDFFDPLHEIYLMDNWLLSTGGEVRWRYMHEVNSRLTGVNNDYDLLRTRLYGDLHYQDRFRLFVEFFDAHSFDPELSPQVIDVDRSDFLNLFIDVKLGEINDAGICGRVGRQELLLGSQRLISPLDWANTRRTFQGARVFSQGKNVDFDLFWAQPVIPDPSHIDRVDSDVHFAGAWLTHRPKKGEFIDLYYLFLDNDSPPVLPGQTRAVAASTHTIGSRWTGNKENFLWDFEGMLQFGDREGEAIFAGAATTGVGWNFSKLPMNPTMWIYYDFASGDQNPDGGDHFSTFNQLFPFGHYYLGWLDLVARQNIHDVNAHFYVYPTDWIFVWLQYHHFELASARDALYNAGGVPLRRDPTGAAGRQVGNEIDLVINFHLSAHSDILIGYSKLFEGDFLRNTGLGGSPEQFFAQYSFRW